MSRFLRLWGGHILLGITICLVLLMLFFVRQSMAGWSYSVVFWNFVLAALTGLLAAVVGILSTWFWETHRDRFYRRRMWRQEDANLAGVPTTTGAHLSRADEAYSAGEEGSTDAVADDR